jgi:hypothetical protein
MDKLESLIARLEKVTSKIEGIEHLFNIPPFA